MKKRTFTRIIIAVLVLSNAVFIWLFLCGPRHLMHESPREIIISRLEFTDQQVQKFEVLIHEHRKEIENEERKIRKAKNINFSGLKNDTNEIDSTSLKVILSSIEKIERAHFKHFQKIRKLCTKEQLPAFNKLMNDIGRIFAPPRPPHPPRK